MSADLPSVAELALVFSKLLLMEIGPHNLAKAIQDNHGDPEPSVCHSHDFCDANVVMDAAFKALTGKTSAQLSRSKQALRTICPVMDDAVAELWSAAWKAAKDADFYAAKETASAVRYEVRHLLDPPSVPAAESEWVITADGIATVSEAFEALVDTLNDEAVDKDHRARFVVVRTEVQYVMAGDEVPEHLLDEQ